MRLSKGFKTISEHKLLIEELMDPSGSFYNEQSSHLPGLECPRRSKSC